MPEVMTNWGYEMDSVPPIISVDEFNVATGNRFASDPRVSSILDATTQAIRDYCGWHVAPVASCKATLTGDGGAILPLPSLSVRSVSKVTEDGRELDSSCYQFRRLGFIRKDCPWSTNWDSVCVEFQSGFDTGDSLKATVCQIASNALAAPAGVREEHAGNVGISYNQTASGVSGGISLLERDMEVLSPYRRVI